MHSVRFETMNYSGTLLPLRDWARGKKDQLLETRGDGRLLYHDQSRQEVEGTAPVRLGVYRLSISRISPTPNSVGIHVRVPQLS